MYIIFMHTYTIMLSWSDVNSQCKRSPSLSRLSKASFWFVKPGNDIETEEASCLFLCSICPTVNTKHQSRCSWVFMRAMGNEQRKWSLIIFSEGRSRKKRKKYLTSCFLWTMAGSSVEKCVAGWAALSRFTVYREPDGFLNTSATRPRLLLWTTHTLSVLCLHPTLWGTARLMFGLKAERQKMLCELWEQKQFSPWGRRSSAGVCSDGLRS